MRWWDDVGVGIRSADLRDIVLDRMEGLLAVFGVDVSPFVVDFVQFTHMLYREDGRW